jgi:hypothetical protein
VSDQIKTIQGADFKYTIPINKAEADADGLYIYAKPPDQKLTYKMSALIPRLLNRSHDRFVSDTRAATQSRISMNMKRWVVEEFFDTWAT